MRAATRRMYDLCVRVLNWTAAHVDDEPGFIVLVAQLQALAARMAQVITDQRNGLIDSRAATSRKQELRRMMLAVPIAHLAQIGALAAREQHELGTDVPIGGGRSSQNRTTTPTQGVAGAVRRLGSSGPGSR